MTKKCFNYEGVFLMIESCIKVAFVGQIFHSIILIAPFNLIIAIKSLYEQMDVTLTVYCQAVFNALFSFSNKITLR